MRGDAPKQGANVKFVGCRVADCDRELPEKVYYRRHHICPYHAALPSMVLDGVNSRWCQQCAKFEPLTLFEGARRSCRKQLTRHNARRRGKQRGETDSDSDVEYALADWQPVRRRGRRRAQRRPLALSDGEAPSSGKKVSGAVGTTEEEGTLSSPSSQPPGQQAASSAQPQPQPSPPLPAPQRAQQHHQQQPLQQAQQVQQETPSTNCSHVGPRNGRAPTGSGGPAGNPGSSQGGSARGSPAGAGRPAPAAWQAARVGSCDLPLDGLRLNSSSGGTVASLPHSSEPGAGALAGAAQQGSNDGDSRRAQGSQQQPPSAAWAGLGGLQAPAQACLGPSGAPGAPLGVSWPLPAFPIPQQGGLEGMESWDLSADFAAAAAAATAAAGVAADQLLGDQDLNDALLGGLDWLPSFAESPSAALATATQSPPLHPGRWQGRGVLGGAAGGEPGRLPPLCYAPDGFSGIWNNAGAAAPQAGQGPLAGLGPLPLRAGPAGSAGFAAWRPQSMPPQQQHQLAPPALAHPGWQQGQGQEPLGLPGSYHQPLASDPPCWEGGPLVGLPSVGRSGGPAALRPQLPAAPAAAAAPRRTAGVGMCGEIEVRLSLKLFNVHPDSLPLHMQQQVGDMVAADPDFMSSTVRSGCAILTVHALVGRERRDELCRLGPEGVAKRLLQQGGWLDEAGEATKGGEEWAADMVVQLDSDATVVSRGALVAQGSTQSVAPCLVAARPVALLASRTEAPPPAPDGLAQEQQQEGIPSGGEAAAADRAEGGATAEEGTAAAVEAGSGSHEEGVVTLWGYGISGADTMVVCRQGDRVLDLEVIASGQAATLPRGSARAAAAAGQQGGADGEAAASSSAAPIVLPEWVAVRPLGTSVGLLQFEVQRDGVLSETVPVVALPNRAAVAEAQQAQHRLSETGGATTLPTFLALLGWLLSLQQRNRRRLRQAAAQQEEQQGEAEGEEGQQQQQEEGSVADPPGQQEAAAGGQPQQQQAPAPGTEFLLLGPAGTYEGGAEPPSQRPSERKEPTYARASVLLVALHAVAASHGWFQLAQLLAEARREGSLVAGADLDSAGARGGLPARQRARPRATRLLQSASGTNAEAVAAERERGGGEAAGGSGGSRARLERADAAGEAGRGPAAGSVSKAPTGGAAGSALAGAEQGEGPERAQGAAPQRKAGLLGRLFRGGRSGNI